MTEVTEDVAKETKALLATPGGKDGGNNVEPVTPNDEGGNQVTNEHLERQNEKVWETCLKMVAGFESIHLLLKEGATDAAHAVACSFIDLRYNGQGDEDGGALGNYLQHRYEPRHESDPDFLKITGGRNYNHEAAQAEAKEYFEKRYPEERKFWRKEPGAKTTAKQARIIDAANELERQVECGKFYGNYTCAEVASMAGTSPSHTHGVLTQAIANGATFKHLRGVGAFRKP